MKHFIKILSLALCAACLLSVTALAAEAAPTADKTEILQPQALAAAKIWGKVSKQENGSLLVTSGDPDSANPEVVIHVSEETYCVDAATGASLDMEKVKDGDTLYVWAGPAMTMSLPPQTTAVVIVGNVPADGKVPQYAEITASAVRSEDEKERVLTIAGGELTVLEDADVSPFRTKNIAALDDLIPGAQILAWTNAAGKADRVLVFPYSYKGYLTANQDGVVLLNGEDVKVKGQIFPVKGEENLEQMYLPLRAVARARWCPNPGRSCSPFSPTAIPHRLPTASGVCWAAAWWTRVRPTCPPQIWPSCCRYTITPRNRRLISRRSSGKCPGFRRFFCAKPFPAGRQVLLSFAWDKPYTVFH